MFFVRGRIKNSHRQTLLTEVYSDERDAARNKEDVTIGERDALKERLNSLLSIIVGYGDSLQQVITEKEAMEAMLSKQLLQSRTCTRSGRKK